MLSFCYIFSIGSWISSCKTKSEYFSVELLVSKPSPWIRCQTCFWPRRQIHHSKSVSNTHTCACRSCSSTGSSSPGSWQAAPPSSSGCGAVSLSALSSTSEPWSLGHDDSLFWSRHLSRTWRGKNRKNKARCKENRVGNSCFKWEKL